MGKVRKKGERNQVNVLKRIPDYPQNHPPQIPIPIHS